MYIVYFLYSWTIRFINISWSKIKQKICGHQKISLFYFWIQIMIIIVMTVHWYDPRSNFFLFNACISNEKAITDSLKSYWSRFSHQWAGKETLVWFIDDKFGRSLGIGWNSRIAEGDWTRGFLHLWKKFLDYSITFFRVQLESLHLKK